MANFGDYQSEIYIGGLSGRQPLYPIRFDELEAKAHAALSPSLVSYVAGGCGNERTQHANVAAFDHWGLIPRMFVGATQRDLSIELFGLQLPTPIFMSPIGVIGLCAAHGHGDIAVARAAANTGGSAGRGHRATVRLRTCIRRFRQHYPYSAVPVGRGRFTHGRGWLPAPVEAHARPGAASELGNGVCSLMREGGIS